MKTLNLLTPLDLGEGFNEFGRYYVTPEGVSYPSITTVLGKRPKPALDDWRKRVGDEEADRITKSSARIGSELHDVCEKFILNDETYSHMSNGCHFLFGKMKPELKNIDNVLGTELALWSDHLKLAGRCDLIADYKGECSIIDYKNSRSIKTYEHCEGYFLQGAAYARMMFERYGIVIKQMVFIIAEWQSMRARVFVEPIKPWLKPLDNVMMEYNPLWKTVN